MKFRTLLCGFLAGLIAQAAQGAASGKPQFEGKDTLIRPEGYRQWVFAGSSLGLRYSGNPEKPTKSSNQQFNNVYINPWAYKTFARTGTFPDGTILILELVRAETKNEPGLQGTYSKDFTGLEAAVKDSKRFPDGWAYFSFDGDNGTRKDKAKPFPRASCFECHDKKAATDHVFTQFYPVLQAAKPGAPQR